MSVICQFEHETIKQDYRRLVLSLMKKGLMNTNPDFFHKMYDSNKTKNFTWSVYLKNAKFTGDNIVLPSRKMIINFSTSSPEISIAYYNAFLFLVNEYHKFGDNKVLVEGVEFVPQEIIRGNYAKFKTQSGIVARDHRSQKYNPDLSDEEHNTDWFYSYEQDPSKFIQVLKKNMWIKYSDYLLVETLEKDIEALEFIPDKLTKSVAKFYEKNIEITNGTFALKGQPYLLNEIYQVSLSSLSGSGYGKLKLIEV